MWGGGGTRRVSQRKGDSGRAMGRAPIPRYGGGAADNPDNSGVQRLAARLAQKHIFNGAGGRCWVRGCWTMPNGGITTGLDWGLLPGGESGTYGGGFQAYAVEARRGGDGGEIRGIRMRSEPKQGRGTFARNDPGGRGLVSRRFRGVVRFGT